MMNSYTELELEKFDQWVRKRLEECKGDEYCYEYVWARIIQKIGDPSRKGIGYGFAGRLRGFLDGAQKIFLGILTIK